MRFLIVILLIALPYALKAECHNYIEIHYRGPRDHPIQDLNIRKDSCEVPFSWKDVPKINVIVPDTVYNYIIKTVHTKDYIKNPRMIDTLDITGCLEITIDSESQVHEFIIPLKPECNLFLMKLITRFELGIGVPYSEQKSSDMIRIIKVFKGFLSLLYVE